MKTLVIIGDLVQSRQLGARRGFQVELARVLEEVSTRNSALVSPYTLTLGDEFQAVYRRADTLFIDLFAIMAAIAPQKARFAIGIGEITTRINHKQALGMDGPAFHRAREAMTELKGTPYLLRVNGGSDSQWRLLNHSLNFLSREIAAWKRNRLQIMRGVLAGESVIDLGGELKISRVAVYKNINAAALEDFKGFCAEIITVLNQEIKAA